LLALALLSSGCGPSHNVFLVGQVYDGATGARLTGYSLTIYYRDQKIDAQVSDTGRFVVKDLPVFQDYTVEISAPGYRAFRSHNAGFNVPNPGTLKAGEVSSTQTFYFDAYMFPSNLVAPAVTLNVRKGTSTGMPASGKVRIRPTSLSSLADMAPELPIGVGAQLWVNDEDLQAKPIARDFNATIALAAGELVYGVRYQVNIYEVAGYQPFEGTLLAGTEVAKTFVLQEETGDPLTGVMANTACRPPTTPNDVMASVISFEFSLDVELATIGTAGGYPEIVDNAFDMTSPDTTINGMRNTLALNTSSGVQERGTSMSVSGKTLTFAWNPAIGLAMKDPADVISQTRWSVTSVRVQPAGKPGQAASLQQLFPLVPFTINCNP
jgi:hypothetical protein